MISLWRPWCIRRDWCIRRSAMFSLGEAQHGTMGFAARRSAVGSVMHMIHSPCIKLWGYWLWLMHMATKDELSGNGGGDAPVPRS